MLSTMSAVSRPAVSAVPPTPMLSSRVPAASITDGVCHRVTPRVVPAPCEDRSVEPFDPADVTWQRASPRLAAARRLTLAAQLLLLMAIPAVLVVLGVPAWVLVADLVLLAIG